MSAGDLLEAVRKKAEEIPEITTVPMLVEQIKLVADSYLLFFVIDI